MAPCPLWTALFVSGRRGTAATACPWPPADTSCASASRITSQCRACACQTALRSSLLLYCGVSCHTLLWLQLGLMDQRAIKRSNMEEVIWLKRAEPKRLILTMHTVRACVRACAIVCVGGWVGGCVGRCTACCCPHRTCPCDCMCVCVCVCVCVCACVRVRAYVRLCVAVWTTTTTTSCPSTRSPRWASASTSSLWSRWPRHASTPPPTTRTTSPSLLRPRRKGTASAAAWMTTTVAQWRCSQPRRLLLTPIALTL